MKVNKPQASQESDLLYIYCNHSCNTWAPPPAGAQSALVKSSELVNEIPVCCVMKEHMEPDGWVTRAHLTGLRRKETLGPTDWHVSFLLTYEYQDHTGRSVLLHLPDPVGDGFKRGAAADVVGHHRPMGTAVVALSYGAETLLSGCVPHLHLW